MLNFMQILMSVRWELTTVATTTIARTLSEVSSVSVVMATEEMASTAVSVYT